MEILYVILAILIVLCIFLWATYNGLVKLNVRVEEAWSDITVQLKRRADLIPMLLPFCEPLFNCLVATRIDTPCLIIDHVQECLSAREVGFLVRDFSGAVGACLFAKIIVPVGVDVSDNLEVGEARRHVQGQCSVIAMLLRRTTLSNPRHR